MEKKTSEEIGFVVTEICPWGFNWKKSDLKNHAAWETKFLGHLTEKRCSLCVLYKIPLTQVNFLLAQLKMHSHWGVGKH